MNQDIHYKLQDIINQDILELLKEYGDDWNNPYDIIFEFEKRLAIDYQLQRAIDLIRGVSFYRETLE